MTAKGSTALAQAELTVALFRKKALGFWQIKSWLMARGLCTHIGLLRVPAMTLFSQGDLEGSVLKRFSGASVCTPKTLQMGEWHRPRVFLGRSLDSHQRPEERTPELESNVGNHGFSLQISPQKAVVITDFCCRTSDVLIFYVYCSICICSERSKFVSVHLNSRTRGSPEHFPLNAETGRIIFSSKDRLNVTLPLAFLF